VGGAYFIKEEQLGTAIRYAIQATENVTALLSNGWPQGIDWAEFKREY
jgi:hypothetical protein